MESGAAVKHISGAGNAENHEDQDLWKGQQGRLHMGLQQDGLLHGEVRVLGLDKCVKQADLSRGGPTEPGPPLSTSMGH